MLILTNAERLVSLCQDLLHLKELKLWVNKEKWPEEVDLKAVIEAEEEASEVEEASEEAAAVDSEEETVEAVEASEVEEEDSE